MEQSNTKQSKPATPRNIIDRWCELNKRRSSTLKTADFYKIIEFSVKVGEGIAYPIGFRAGLEKAKEIYDKAAQDQTVDPETKYEPVEHVEPLISEK